MPLKYVLVKSSLEELETLALNPSIQSVKKRDLQRTHLILSNGSQTEHEFIKQPVSLVTEPTNFEMVTPLDLDNFMCYCIFGYILPDDYYDIASKVFASKCAKSNRECKKAKSVCCFI